jgi:hypothetical protein
MAQIGSDEHPVALSKAFAATCYRRAGIGVAPGLIDSEAVRPGGWLAAS